MAGAIGTGIDGELLQRAYLRERRPAARPRDQAIERGVVALEERLDAAVGAVTYPAIHAEAQRFVAQRVAKADALYAPSYTNLPRAHVGFRGAC